MANNPLRDLFNRYKWAGQGYLHLLTVRVTHRGAPGNVREIDGMDIKEVGPNGLEVAANLEFDTEDVLEAGSAFIPYHRIQKVTDNKQVMWEQGGTNG